MIGSKTVRLILMFIVFLAISKQIDSINNDPDVHENIQSDLNDGESVDLENQQNALNHNTHPDIHNNDKNNNEGHTDVDNEHETNNQINSHNQTTHNEGNQHQTHQTKHKSHFHHPNQLSFWINVLFSAFLTCVGAFCSGMTVGLMSIETMQLEIMKISGTEQEKNLAKRILNIVHDHHLWLVTLLLANAMALESLPIVVHSLMPAWAAILFSTIIVLIVAEIVPQAVCTGPKKMTIAFYAAPIISFMIKFLWILAYPMAKGLDKLLGQHHHQRIQHKDFANFLTGGSQNLKSTQKLLLTSILQLRTQRVPKIMVPLKNLYMLELYERLTISKIKQINKKDYSYILVYKGDKSNVVGIIKTKEFALKYLKALAKGQKIHAVENVFEEKQDLLCVYEDTNLLEMLMIFQARSKRFAIVIGKKKKIEPGIESIMYSAREMVANNAQGQILGIIFLYSIFEEIAEYNETIARGEELPQNKTSQDVEMTELRKPLI